MTMRLLRIAFLLLMLVSPDIIHGTVEARLTQDRLEPATALFKEGRFAEAEIVCSKLIAGDPKNYRAIVVRGRIALLSNDLRRARADLTNATKLNPQDLEPKLLLAEA